MNFLQRSRKSLCKTCRGGCISRLSSNGRQQQEVHHAIERKVSRTTFPSSRINESDKWHHYHIPARQSFSSSTQVDLEAQSKLQKRIEEICDDTVVPYGEMSLTTWKESLELLSKVTKLQDLTHSLELLERLVIEQASPRTIDSDPLPTISTEDLNEVIQQWSRSWKRPPQDETSITPSEMLSLLDDWIYRDNNLHPDRNTYLELMKGATKDYSNPAETISFAENLFQRMVSEASDKIHPNVRPNSEVYLTIVKLMARLGELTKAEAIIKIMYMDYASGNTSVEPNLEVFTALLSGYAEITGTSRDPRNEVPARAEGVLRHMHHLHASGSLRNVHPNSSIYSLVLKCWSKSKDPKAGVNSVKTIFAHMEQDTHVRPTSQALGLTLSTLSKAGDGEGAQALLDKYLQGLSMNSKALKPDRQSFKSVLWAWANSGSPEALENSEQLFRRMKELATEGILPHARPDSSSYEALLSCLVKDKSSVKDRVHRAESLLQEMEELAQAGDKLVKPRTKSYHYLISLYVSDARDPSKGEEVLERMYSFQAKDGSKDTQPDNYCLNLILKAFADEIGENSARRAEGILERWWKRHASDGWCRPDTIAYKSVLTGLSNSPQPDAAERCQQLLDEMKAMSIVQDGTCYELVVLQLARADKPAEAEGLLEECQERKLGVASLNLFASIIQSWFRVGKPDEAEKLVTRMQHYHKSGFLQKAPDRAVYFILIQGWLESTKPWACEKAENVLYQMNSLAEAGNDALAPTTTEFNAVLHGFGISGRPAKAQKLLDWMIHQYFEGSERCKPDLVSFTSVFQAWKNAKENGDGKVESLLERMDELHNSGKIEGVKPNTECLNLALACMSKQIRHVRPRRVESLLRKYEPVANNASWTIAMDCFSSLGNARKAETLMRSTKRIRPDTTMYNSVLEAWSNAMDADKGDKADALIREMYREHEKGEMTKPNSRSFTMVMLSYLKSDHPEVIQRVEALKDEVLERARRGEEDLIYDSIMFDAVMRSHCHHGNPQDAESMLDQLCQENEYEWEKRSNSFASVLGAWVRSNNPERAESILKRMREYRDRNQSIQPVPKNYIDVVECWNRSDKTEAGEHEDGILQMLEADFPGVLVGKMLYLKVLKKLAESGSARRAEALLRRVQSLHDDERSKTDMDLFMYREVCLAWKKSRDVDASSHLQSLEKDMKERFGKNYKSRT